MLSSGVRIIPGSVRGDSETATSVQRTSSPTTNDAGYPVSCLWLNTESQTVWAHFGSGVWVNLTASSSSGGGLGTPTSVTISGGAITVTGSGAYIVSGEGGIADNLDQIVGGSEGDEIVIGAVNSSYTITVRHNQNNIHIGSDFGLDHIDDRIRLIKQSDGNWVGGGIANNA